jgi:hypothetical protein
MDGIIILVIVIPIIACVMAVTVCAFKIVEDKFQPYTDDGNFLPNGSEALQVQNMRGSFVQRWRSLAEYIIVI